MLAINKNRCILLQGITGEDKEDKETRIVGIDAKVQKKKVNEGRRKNNNAKVDEDHKSHRIEEMLLDTIDAKIKSFREEHRLDERQVNINATKEPSNAELTEELNVINKKCNDFAQVLLAQHYDLHAYFSAEHEKGDQSLNRVNILC